MSSGPTGIVQYVGAQNPHSEEVNINGYQNFLINCIPGEILTLPQAVCGYLVGLEPNWWSPAGGWSPPAAGPQTGYVAWCYSAYTVLATNGVVVADPTSGGSFVVTLPDATTVGGQNVTLVHPGTAHTVTIDPFSGQTIGSANSFTLSADNAVELYSDGGTSWRVLSETGGGGSVAITSPDTSITVGGSGSAPTLEVASTVRVPTLSAGQVVTGAPSTGTPAAQAKLTVDARDYGVLANGATHTDGAITAGQATLSSTGYSFQSSDVGKLCTVVGAGAPVATTLSSAFTAATSYSAIPVAALSAAIPAGGVYVNAGQLGTVSTAGASAIATAVTGQTTISSIGVNALAAAIPAGTVTIQSGYWQQKFTTSGAAMSATSIPITLFGNAGSMIPNFAYPSGATITVQQEFLTVGAPAGATSLPLMGPFLGHLMGNSSNLVSGTAYTSLKTNYLYVGVANTANVTVINGGNSQTFVTSASASAAAATISVTSQNANANYPTGSILVGPAVAQAAAYSFPIGSIVTTVTPALSTTIQSVSGGVATLAASASTTVAGQAEFFFATDDTVALQAAWTATPIGGTLELPSGEIGISAAVGGANAITVKGQGITEKGAGAPTTTYSTVLYYPMMTASYLKGSVIVQCSANTDAIQLSGTAVSQNIEKFGVRFAGRFVNTGHAINNSCNSIQSQGYHDIGNASFRWHDVSVFGHDGNHWAFLINNAQYGHLSSLHSQGGGGLSFRQDNGDLWAGQTKIDAPYCNVHVAGSCSAIEAASYTSSTSIQNVNLFSPSGWIGGPTYNVPQQFCQVIQPNNGSCQAYMHTVSGYGYLTGPNYGAFQACSIYSPYFLGGGFTGSGNGPGVGYFVGPGCTSSGTYPPSGGAGPFNFGQYPYVASGTAYQNGSGYTIAATFPVVLEPPGSSIATTTLSSSPTFGATSFTVTSASGLAVGQAILIDTGSLSEYAIIRTLVSTTVGLSKPLTFGHTSGAALVSGFAYACLYKLGDTSVTGTFAAATLEQHTSGEAAAAPGDNQRLVTLSMMIPNAYCYRIDCVNAYPQYADFQPLY